MGIDVGPTRPGFRVALLSAIGIFVVSIGSSCARHIRPPLPTVDGPEAQDLIKRATGCVVFDHPVAGISALAVPDLKEVVVRQPNSAHDALHSVAGPDADGWVVFVDYNMETHSHCMKRIRFDGTSEESVFCRDGDALWDNPMSNPVLAPRGGNVAFLTQPVKRFAPPIVWGPIDVWNIRTKTEHPTNVIAMNHGLSWFPDGQRLTYVQPGKPEAVYVLDVESGERSPLHKGQFALVSTDGDSVLVNTEDGNLVANLKTGESKKVDWPGKWGGPIAFIGKDLVLYWGLPTTGAAPKVTENNSPLVGPKPMGTLKLADLFSGRFQTVVPYIDPRREVSFGIAGACP